MEIVKVFGQIMSFDCWNLYTEIVEPTKIGNLLVALAIDGGMPKKIIAGKVMADPLLASVFIKPLNKPQNKKSNTANMSIVIKLNNTKKCNNTFFNCFYTPFSEQFIDLLLITR